MTSSEKSHSCCPGGLVGTSTSLPNTDLEYLRRYSVIQVKVDQRIRELQELNQSGVNNKLKSQRGGNVEVLIKNKIKWHDEYILSGTSKERISYDQFTIVQFVTGFGRVMRDELDPEIRAHMLDYMIALSEDAQDFFDH